MALTAVKFTSFAAALLSGSHSLHTDTIKAAFTNTAPTAATDTVFAPGSLHPAPAAANGYAPVDIENSVSANKVLATDKTITATAGGIGPFRYIILYNDTSATDLLIQYYDYGSEITLANAGDNIVLDIDGTNGILTI